MTILIGIIMGAAPLSIWLYLSERDRRHWKKQAEYWEDQARP